MIKKGKKAVESYNAANYPFKVGEKVIFTLNRSGIIEKIYANDYGDFSYDIRTIKKGRGTVKDNYSYKYMGKDI